MRLKPGVNRWAFLLGLVGVVGLLGLFTGNGGWFGFFGFFGFWGLATVRIDERFGANVARAGRNGYFVALPGLVAVLMLLALQVPVETVALTVAGLYAALILVFVFSFIVYDRRGD